MNVMTILKNNELQTNRLREEIQIGKPTKLDKLRKKGEKGSYGEIEVVLIPIGKETLAGNKNHESFIKEDRQLYKIPKSYKVVSTSSNMVYAAYLPKDFDRAMAIPCFKKKINRIIQNAIPKDSIF